MTGLDHRSIESVQISKLKPAARNARTHTRRQVQQIAESIRRFGFTNPVLIDDGNGNVAGHGRVLAAKLLGLTEVPCLRLANLSALDVRAYVIADNKLALNAGWDVEILAAEMQGLMEEGFDVGLTGFDLVEVDAILTEADLSASVSDQPEDYHPWPRPEVVTQRGDLWILGRHRLLCDDAKDQSAVELVMDGGRADMVFTDPPYNVHIEDNVSGLPSLADIESETATSALRHKRTFIWAGSWRQSAS